MAPVPKRFLSYAVLLEADGNHGSGFFYSDRTSLFLVSAKHVLFKNKLEIYKTPLRMSSIDADEDNSRLSYELDCQTLFTDGNLRKHATADVAAVRIASLNLDNTIYKVAEVPGVTGDAPLDTWSLIGMFEEDAIRLDDIEVGTDVLLIGYPTSLADPDLFEKSTPLLRAGIVAGMANDAHIVIDCPVYFGNSGGLVLAKLPDVEEHKAIGIASRMVPFQEKLFSKEFQVQVGIRYENSGYAIVEPMDRVFELLADFAVP